MRVWTENEPFDILLALLELEDDSGTLTSLGLQKKAAETEIRAIIEAIVADKDVS